MLANITIISKLEAILSQKGWKRAEKKGKKIGASPPCSLYYFVLYCLYFYKRQRESKFLMWRRGHQTWLVFWEILGHGQFLQTAPPSSWWVINSSSVSVNVNEFIFYQQRELRRVIGRWEEGLRTFMYLPPKLGFRSFTLS